MEVLQVLHMNKGVGETSYAKNSTLQGKLISIGKPITEEAIVKTLSNNVPESMGIAELGCSSGPNALLAISDMIDNIYAGCGSLDRPMPEELRVYLNDLPSNDFNNIFGSLPEFYNKLKTEKGSDQYVPCYILGVPGSFYGRLFPSKSLHFVHSSSSLHWLSQVPPGLDSETMPPLNKGKIYVSKTSPPSVLAAYALQFQNDFSLFLRSRSAEVVSGGRMVLSFMGRTSTDLTDDNCDQLEFFAQALMSMVSEGIIEEEKVDSFNAPYYAPSTEELKTAIEKEGSFIVEGLDAFEIDWDEGCDYKSCDAEPDIDNDDVGNGACTELENLSCGQRVAKTIRAVGESLLACQFGSHILDDLFQRLGKIIDDHLSKTSSYKFTHLVLSLVRNG